MDQAQTPQRRLIVAGDVTIDWNLAHLRNGSGSGDVWAADDLSRACLAQASDSIPRVILLGRLSLYGRGAERLHEFLVESLGALDRTVPAQGEARGLRAGSRGENARASRSFAR